jgi:hypothetical protein
MTDRNSEMWETFKLTDSAEHDDCSNSERTHSTDALTYRTKAIYLDGFSNMCEELFGRDRRNIKLSGLQNKSSFNKSKFTGSQTLTNSDEPVGAPTSSLSLGRYVNASYKLPQEPSSSKILPTVERKQENLSKYVHPVLSADRKDVVLDVECGPNKGLLYLSRLYRGSRGACILYHKMWLTPNQFQAVSGRETAKDWKRSIRHRGRSIKLLMSKGILPQNSEYLHQTSTNFHVSTLFVVTMARNVFGACFGIFRRLFKVEPSLGTIPVCSLNNVWLCSCGWRPAHNLNCSTQLGTSVVIAPRPCQF